MKKLLSIVLAILMVVSVLALVACKGNTTPEAPKTLKFGMGVAVSAKASNATPANEEEEIAAKDGSCEVDSTVAVITVDADGKVVACKIDSAQIKGSWTVAGVANETTDFRTKLEKGNDYGMSKIGKKEWFEQAAAFEGVVVGKTLAEIKALVAEGGKGVEAVTTAGCTITISGFVKAIEKAFANLADSNATAASTLKLGLATKQEKQDNAVAANEEEEIAAKDGTIEFDTTIFAAAVDANGKVVAVDTDCTQVKFTFDAAGASTFTATEVATKRERGNDYGMSKIGKKEWFEQADAFETQCLGKTAAEIVALVGTDGKGVEAVQTAGCTITASGFAAAAAKIAPAK